MATGEWASGRQASSVWSEIFVDNETEKHKPHRGAGLIPLLTELQIDVTLVLQRCRPDGAIAGVTDPRSVSASISICA